MIATTKAGRRGISAAFGAVLAGLLLTATACGTEVASEPPAAQPGASVADPYVGSTNAGEHGMSLQDSVRPMPVPDPRIPD